MSRETTPHELLGRRFEFTKVTAPDFTVISYNQVLDDLYVHARSRAGERREHLSLRLTLRAIRAGHIIESDKAPFILERQ